MWSFGLLTLYCLGVGLACFKACVYCWQSFHNGKIGWLVPCYITPVLILGVLAAGLGTFFVGQLMGSGVPNSDAGPNEMLLGVMMMTIGGLVAGTALSVPTGAIGMLLGYGWYHYVRQGTKVLGHASEVNTHDIPGGLHQPAVVNPWERWTVAGIVLFVAIDWAVCAGIGQLTCYARLGGY